MTSATGLGSPQIRRSTDDGLTWELVGTVWDAETRPEWAYEAVPGVSNFWAPEVIEHDGTFYLYYSASTFGSNRSAIGLTTNTTLDPDDPDYAWVDQGEVLRSEPGETDYNAIDPGVITDADGTPWMAFGSFWGGIQLVELSWPSRQAGRGCGTDDDRQPHLAAERDRGALPGAPRRLVLPVRVARLLLPGHRLDVQHRRRALAGRHRSVRRPVRQGHDRSTAASSC